MTGLERIEEQLATLAVVRRAHGFGLDGVVLCRGAVHPPVVMMGTGATSLPPAAENDRTLRPGSADTFEDF